MMGSCDGCAAGLEARRHPGRRSYAAATGSCRFCWLGFRALSDRPQVGFRIAGPALAGGVDVVSGDDRGDGRIVEAAARVR